MTDTNVVKVSGLSGNALKFIAIVTMTIDHVVWLLFPGMQHVWWIMGLHAIGRITAPTMWFFMAEGFHYTRDVGKYISRMFIFAVISHFAYTFAGGISFVPTSIFNATSVMWPLAWSVVLMLIHSRENISGGVKMLMTIIICLITFPADWSSIAAMCPLFLLGSRGDFKKQATWIMTWSAIYAVVYFFAMDKAYGLLQLATCLCLPFLYFYNGERGKWKGMKWFFYIYYPAHLFLIGFIRIFILHQGAIFP